ncbi:MAG: nucleotidyltransferase family protein [bacterium]
MQQRFGDALKEIRLFGSRARGEHTPESDLDIMILLDIPVDWRLRKEIRYMLVDIDLEYEVLLSSQIFSVAEWQSPMFRITPLFKSIEREGISL